MSEAFIKTEHLCFSYKDNEAILGASRAVNDLSLEIKAGEHIAILGHNGSGKSTLAKLLNMILEADSGKIFVKGKEITAEDFSDDDLFELRKNIGMVFQNPDNQLVSTVVEEDVAFGPENLGIESSEIRRRVDEALAAVGMSEYAKFEPHRLSGGQKQRVAIAGIIAMMPECIILDESTAMLDPSGRREVIATIRKLNKERGITIINITHYMSEAALADRILVMNGGSLFMQGAPEEIFSRPEELVAAGLDVPQCTSLVMALRKKGIAVEGDISTPELCADAICKALGK